MSSIVNRLIKLELINPPSFLQDNICYETMMGSIAYGTSSDSSDIDIYGFCIPRKDDVFPHLRGEILGFGKNIQRFDQWQEHHIENKQDGKEYDLQIFNIVKYFQLCMDNNPNMLDSLFVPRFCIRYSNKIGEMVRERRRDFLHKGAYFKFKGYAFAQMSKMSGRNVTGKRKEMVDKWGFDLKFGSHLLRLLDECWQILEHGDLDLQRNKEQLKAVRRGEWTEAQIKEWAASKEKVLEELYVKSSLPNRPDEEKLKQLLLDCLEEHYGNLSSAINIPSRAESTLSTIIETLKKNNHI